MKINIADLEKALKWIAINSFEPTIKIEMIDHKMSIKTFDKHSAEVEITIFEDGTMMPKVKKTETL